MSNLAFTIWNLNPEIFSSFISPRWYGLLFALGFLVSQQILFWMLKAEVHTKDLKKRAEKDVEALTVNVVLSTIIGARLGHVLFYEPEKYLENPLDVLKIWEGGLASHGATISILIGLWLFARKRPNWTWLQIVDRIVIVVALAGCLIRLGNFMNSEIYGYPTNSNYGVVFARYATDAITNPTGPAEDVSYNKKPKTESGKFVPIEIEIKFKNGISDEEKESFVTRTIPNYLGGRYPHISDHVTIDSNQDLSYTIAGNTAIVQAEGIPRHPTQLYESLSSLLLFFVLLALWNKTRENTPHGRIFGLFLIILFGLRFFHEYFKENQVAFEDSMELNMGQILSIPAVLLGIYIFVRSYKHQGTGS